MTEPDYHDTYFASVCKQTRDSTTRDQASTPAQHERVMSQVTHSGLEAWVSRVRNELASATGMAEFTERVQTRGFDWMSNFVNSVLHDETIVEIAKTPGRQKSTKTRSRTAAIAASAVKLRAINNETRSDEVPNSKTAKHPASPALSRVQLITGHKSPHQPSPPSPLSPTPVPKNASLAGATFNALLEEPCASSHYSPPPGDQDITLPPVAAPAFGSTSGTTQAEVSTAPPVNTHIDVVVPLNGGDGTHRQSLFKGASQAARQSGGAGLRRSTFARSFAPRSRVVSSSAGDAATAVEAVNSNTAANAATHVAPQSAPNAKRKSDVLEAGDEAAPVGDAPRKIRKLDQSPATTLVERDTAPKPVDLPSQQATSTAAVSPVAEASSLTEVGAHGTIATPSVSEAEVSSKTPLAQLAALAQDLTTGSRQTTSGATLAESTSEPRRAPSLYPNTRTFDMRELMGDNYECPDSAKSPSENSRSESDGDGVDHDDEAPSDDDVAVTFDKDSFTPANSPPNFAKRAGYSVPEAVPESQSPANVSEVASVNTCAGHDRSLETHQIASVSCEQQNLVGSTSASSILSVAKAVVTNFFKPATQSATPTPPAQPPVPQPAAVTLSVVSVPLPGTFNPFTMDLPEPRPTTVRVNPFLASPAKPSPPSPEESQLLHQETQSTAFSSQATGASLFGSQPFTRRASYENPEYDTDITESQFSQSQFGKSTFSGEVEDERQDVDEVAAALAQGSPDVSIHVRHSPARETANVPTATGEPVPVNHRGPAAPRDIAPQSKVAHAPVKTLKHVPNVMSLSAKNKSDAQRVKTQQSAKRPGGLAKGAATGQQDEADTKKRERDETAPHLAQSTKSKTDDDANKKRKLDAETRLKAKQGPNLKNSSSTSQIGVPKQPARPPFKSNLKPVSSMTVSASGAPPKMAGGLPTKSSAFPGTTMRPPPQPYVNPQAQIQAKMQATLDAQIAKEKAALMVRAQTRQKLRNVEPEPEPAEEEEEIELPDIASEYSNSDDEDRPSKIMAEWAEPAELEKLLLRQQAEIDPDELFGEVGEPNLEAMFGPRNKFRVRSSSANWHNGDGLTAAESAEYARRMRE